MASTWLQVRVELEGGGGIDCDPPPGRVLLLGPSHTFTELAASIDLAFARWDLAHLHEFELSDGRRIGLPDPDSDQWLDGSLLKVARELAPGDEFTYTFDLGDDWRHRCRVLPETFDPLEEWGERPGQPVTIDGWGWIPDQYGRETEELDEL